jgi:adenine-specific DNA-methyltransferase
METLDDQPEIKSKVERVTGPFTVEGLQPHRSIESGTPSTEADNAARFVREMLDQLRETGVTNTRKGEKIMFTTLDLIPGKHIQATGTYEQAGQISRAAVLIGPQYGTISRDMIRAAATEAVRSNDINTLIACGFAFDPTVTEVTNLGRLLVLTARINPDLLLMGKDLKKDAKTNLFTVFGEPDVEVDEAEEGRLVVHLLGVDVYDPNTGSLRINSTDEIACWFIDTNYNDASFFVCHAYFTGAGEPYDKLKAALKAEINPEAWEMLYRTESIPFDRPKTGKIAVKVINHYGDEVMKVIEVA